MGLEKIVRWRTKKSMSSEISAFRYILNKCNRNIFIRVSDVGTSREGEYLCPMK